ARYGDRDTQAKDGNLGTSPREIPTQSMGISVSRLARYQRFHHAARSSSTQNQVPPLPWELGFRRDFTPRRDLARQRVFLLMPTSCACFITSAAGTGPSASSASRNRLASASAGASAGLAGRASRSRAVRGL